MGCRLVGTNPFSETMLEYCLFEQQGWTSVKSLMKFIHFIQESAFENVVWWIVFI